MQRDGKIEAIERFFVAYGEDDRDGIASVLADEIEWTIPGHHPLAGTKRGIDEVLAFFAELGRAGFRAETLFLGSSDEYVVDIHRGYSTSGVAGSTPPGRSSGISAATARSIGS